MEHSTEKDALVAALAAPLREMLETRFPAWRNDSGGYRYAEFIDRVAGIAAEAGVRVTPPAFGITPGGNPTCLRCGRWYGPGETHTCLTPPAGH